MSPFIFYVVVGKTFQPTLVH